MARIFVLDDSRSILEMVVQMLQRAGHDVLSSSSASELFKTLQLQQLDLLVSDIYMPEQDGLEVISKTRRLHPSVKIISMSSMTGPMNMLPAARLMGASAILQKPFTEEALLKAVSVAIGPANPPPPTAAR